MSRTYNQVGEIVDGEQLSRIEGQRVRKFATTDEAHQFVTDNAADPNNPTEFAGSICLITSENEFHGFVFDAAGAGTWQALRQPSRSLADIVPKSRRVPNLPVKWENARGVLTLPELHAGSNIAGHTAIAAAEEVVGDEVFYALTTSGTYAAQATTEVEFLLVGGGGSGSGAAFLDQYAASGVQHASSPIAGSGGAAGLIQAHRLTLHQGDTVSVEVGAGGQVEDISGSTQINQVAEGRAGGDTILRVNGVEVARAYGGSGGLDPTSLPARDRMLLGGDRHPSFNAAAAGGGIVAPGGAAWSLGSSPHFPQGWQQPNLRPPFGTVVRAGEGFASTDEIVADAQVGSSASEPHWVIVGGGSQGTTTSGEGDTSAGERTSYPAGVSGSVMRATHARTKSAGVSQSWGSATYELGQSGAPAVVFGSQDELTATDLAGGAVSASQFGYGGDGGAAWQRAVSAASSLDASFNIAAAQNGGAGVVFVKHSLPATRLADTPNNRTYKAKQFFNSTPAAPTLSFDVPPDETSAGFVLGFRVNTRDDDVGDPISWWQMRRRLVLDDGSEQISLLRQTREGSWSREIATAYETATGSPLPGSIAGTLEGQWAPIGEVEEWTNPATSDEGATFSTRTLPRAETNAIETYASLTPVWVPYSSRVSFEVRSADSAGQVSEWSAPEFWDIADNFAPAAPVLTSIPQPALGQLINLQSRDDGLDLSFTYSDPEDDTLWGLVLLKVSRLLTSSGRGTLFVYHPGDYQSFQIANSGAASEFFEALTDEQEIDLLQTGNLVWDVPLVGDGVSTESNWIGARRVFTIPLARQVSTGSPLASWNYDYDGLTLLDTHTEDRHITFVLMTISNRGDTSSDDPADWILELSPTSNPVSFIQSFNAVEVSGALSFNAFQTGGEPQERTFSVDPANASMSTFFNPSGGAGWSANLESLGGGNYTLRVTPPTTHNASNASVILFLRGFASGHTTFLQDIVVFHDDTGSPPDTGGGTTTPSLSFGSLPSSYDLVVGTEEDFSFTISADPDQFDFEPDDVSVCGMAISGSGTQRTLRLSPQSAGSTIVRIVAQKDGYLTANYAGTVNVAAAPVVPPPPTTGGGSPPSLTTTTGGGFPNFIIVPENATRSLDGTITNGFAAGVQLIGSGSLPSYITAQLFIADVTGITLAVNVNPPTQSINPEDFAYSEYLNDLADYEANGYPQVRIRVSNEHGSRDYPVTIFIQT